VPRITAVPLLPSTLFTVSASASSSFRGSISHPIRLLGTLRSGRRLPPRNTHYQAGATPYLGRTSTGWITPACLAHEQKTYTSLLSRLIDTGRARVAQRPEFTSGDKIRQREGVSAEHVDVLEPKG
jgi:hypothetical protein